MPMAELVLTTSVPYCIERGPNCLMESMPKTSCLFCLSSVGDQSISMLPLLGAIQWYVIQVKESAVLVGVMETMDR